MSTLYEVIACQDDFHLKARLPQKAAVQVNEGGAISIQKAPYRRGCGGEQSCCRC